VIMARNFAAALRDVIWRDMRGRGERGELQSDREYGMCRPCLDLPSLAHNTERSKSHCLALALVLSFSLLAPPFHDAALICRHVPLSFLWGSCSSWSVPVPAFQIGDPRMREILGRKMVPEVDAMTEASRVDGKRN
jgi:hypothetical protein